MKRLADIADDARRELPMIMEGCLHGALGGWSIAVDEDPANLGIQVTVRVHLESPMSATVRISGQAMAGYGGRREHADVLRQAAAGAVKELLPHVLVHADREESRGRTEQAHAWRRADPEYRARLARGAAGDWDP